MVSEGPRIQEVLGKYLLIKMQLKKIKKKKEKAIGSSMSFLPMTSILRLGKAGMKTHQTFGEPILSG